MPLMEKEGLVVPFNQCLSGVLHTELSALMLFGLYPSAAKTRPRALWRLNGIEQSRRMVKKIFTMPGSTNPILIHNCRPRTWKILVRNLDSR